MVLDFQTSIEQNSYEITHLVESFSFAILFLEKVTFSEVKQSGGGSNMICVRRFGGLTVWSQDANAATLTLLWNSSLSSSLLKGVVRNKDSKLLWKSSLLSFLCCSNPSWGYKIQMMTGTEAQCP